MGRREITRHVVTPNTEVLMDRTSPPTTRVARALATVVVTAALSIPAACRDSSPTAVIITPPDRSLVGTWKGGIMRDIDDTPVTFTLTLRADSTSSAAPQGINPSCPLVGSWTVSGGRLTVSTRENCTAGVATFTAPVTVGHISGTWTAGTVKGTFDVTKQ